MREIKARLISREEFAPYGVFYDMIHPDGYALCGEFHKFYPDRVHADSCRRLGFSPIQVRKPTEMIIDTLEYHTSTWEMILPLNDDMIFHAAPASGQNLVTELTKAFIVPKGTIIMIYPAIWHLAPFPLNESKLSAMVILQECTYINDCRVVELPEAKRFKIIV